METSQGSRSVGILIIVLLIACSCWTLLFLQVKPQLLSGMSDFSVLYCVGKMVLAGHGSQMYDYETLKHVQEPFLRPGTIALPFVWPPYIMVVFAGLAMLPYSWSVATWYAINVLVVLSIPFLLRHRLGLTDKQTALAVIALVLFYPIAVCLSMGQITILTLFLFAVVFLDLDDGKDFRAGCVLAVAIYKPQFVLVPLLAFILMRKWRAVGGFVAMCIALFLLCVGVAGWKTTVGFPRAVSAFQHLPEFLGGEHPERMPNLRGLVDVALGSHFKHSYVVLAATLASAGLALIICVVTLRGKKNFSELTFSLVVIVCVLSSYHAYRHDMVLLVLPLLLVAHQIAHIESPWAALILTMISAVAFFSPTLMPPWASSIVLLAFAIALFAEIRRQAGATLGPEITKTECP